MTPVRIFLTIIVLYLAFAIFAFVMQRRMLYFPGQVRPSEEWVQMSGLAPWPAPNADYRGFVGVEPTGEPKGTVVVFHGNAGMAVDRSYYVRALTPLGYRVLLAEYPGYGGRSGRPSEATFVADARETVKLAHQEFGSPIFLWGESLGGGVATALAADPPVPIAGVVLVTPWDSLPRLAQSIYWFFPARWFVLDKYDNVANLQSYGGRVAVALAEKDEVVPIRHGRRLYESVDGPKKLWLFENAGHNSWPIHPEASWWNEVMQFLGEE